MACSMPAGPGHGKAVISAWILANENAALARPRHGHSRPRCLQAVVAVALVACSPASSASPRAAMTETVTAVETGQLRRGGARRGRAALDARPGASRALGPAAGRRMPTRRARPADRIACTRTCPAPIADNSFPWRAAASAVFAAGVRPCSGAIIVLVFALAQGVFAAGVAAAFAMALGMALTTGALAALSVFAKVRPCGFASGRGEAGARLVGAIEVLAAAVVLAFGAALSRRALDAPARPG